MLNKTIIAGRLAPSGHPATHGATLAPRSATLSRKELRRIIEEMLG